MAARSPREERIADHVAAVDAPMPEETPAERLARHTRNWQELKKARMLALRQGNTKGVQILDEELAAGRGSDFPQDTDFSDFIPDSDTSDFIPDAPAKSKKPQPASQGAVRKAEPPMMLIEQEADERAFDAARRKFQAGGGALKPGQTVDQATAEQSGLRNPAETRGAAEAKHAAATGELQYGDSLAYNAAKPAAAIAGFSGAIPFVPAGPLGATMAEGLVRATAIGYNLNTALDHGMAPEQAADILVNEMAKGVGVDLLFNFGTPLVGQLIAKIPGLNRISGHLAAAIEKRIGQAPRPDLREAKIDKLAKGAATPERGAAVRELAKRVEGDYVPTPGQVRGDAGFTERRVYEAFPGEFQRQEAAMGKAAEQLRADTVKPLSQYPGEAATRPDAKDLGTRITDITDRTVKATKDRLRPTFQLANEQKVYSDFSNVAKVAQDALRRNADMGGGKLTDAEVGHLQKLVQRYAPDNPQGPWASAEAALDFASTQKAMGRKLNADGEPTAYFSTIVSAMTKEADRAFDSSLNSLGKGRVKTLLDAARTDYRKMNEAVYDGAIKQALRKKDNSPEDIARLLFANGKVTRIEQLDEMLRLARKEGVVGSTTTSKLQRDLTRAFLQKSVQDVDDAAKFSRLLADPDRAATWAALTKGPNGTALKNGMAVLEQAAQMSKLAPSQRQSTIANVPLSRAAGAGLGVSWVTASFNPALFGAGLSIAGTMRLMATAYTHGDKGTINLITKVLRSNSTGTAASAKALQSLLPELNEAAKKYDVTDLFMKDEQSEKE